MKAQTLSLKIQDLNTREVKNICVLASNPFMLSIKYLSIANKYHIESWTLINNDWEAGNTGLNAGAYLCETMEELTGMNLA